MILIKITYHKQIKLLHTPANFLYSLCDMYINIHRHSFYSVRTKLYGKNLIPACQPTATHTSTNRVSQLCLATPYQSQPPLDRGVHSRMEWVGQDVGAIKMLINYSSTMSVNAIY